MAFVLGPGRSEPQGRDLWGPCSSRGVKDHCGLVPVSVCITAGGGGCKVVGALHADSLYGFGLKVSEELTETSNHRINWV